MLVFILVRLICGFVDGTLGIGFGVTSISILMTFGVAPAIASARSDPNGISSLYIFKNTFEGLK